MQNVWFDGLQVLRGILFIAIFLSHSSAFITSYGLWGGAAVATFFVMSGFLSGYYYDKERDSDFWIVACLKSVWKKIKKFYFSYLIMLLIAALYLNKGEMSIFFKNLFLIQSWFGSSSALSFNKVSWFLSSIMLSYLLAPLINRACNKTPLYSCVLIIIFLMIQVFVAMRFRGGAEPGSQGYYTLYMFPPVRMLDFMEGVAFSRIYKNLESRKWLNEDILTIIEGIIVLMYIFLLTIGESIPYNLKATLIWILPSVGLVWIFALQKGKITMSCAKCKILYYLGGISFELFIVHRMVLTFFAHLSPSPISLLVAFIVTVIIAECFASCLRLDRTFRKKYFVF